MPYTVRGIKLTRGSSPPAWPSAPFTVLMNTSQPDPEWIHVSYAGQAGSLNQSSTLSSLIKKLQSTFAMSPTSILGDMSTVGAQGVHIYFKLTPRVLPSSSYSTAMDQPSIWVNTWGAKEMDFEIGSGNQSSMPEGVFQIRFGQQPHQFDAGASTGATLNYSTFQALETGRLPVDRPPQNLPSSNNSNQNSSVPAGVHAGPPGATVLPAKASLVTSSIPQNLSVILSLSSHAPNFMGNQLLLNGTNTPAITTPHRVSAVFVTSPPTSLSSRWEISDKSVGVTTVYSTQAGGDSGEYSSLSLARVYQERTEMTLVHGLT